MGSDMNDGRLFLADSKISFRLFHIHVRKSDGLYIALVDKTLQAPHVSQNVTHSS